jgi:hypothetical protein
MCKVLVYPNVQQRVHSHGPAQTVDYPGQGCRFAYETTQFSDGGDIYRSGTITMIIIYIPRGGGYVRRVRMLFQLFRSWMWLLWFLRLAKLAQSLHMLSFYEIG